MPSALARVSLVNWTSSSYMVGERRGGEKEGRRNEERDEEEEKKEGGKQW